MPTQGRPRLTPEVLQTRIAAYCQRFKTAPGPKGLPPFPTGKRETPQHREWIGLYKAHSRLGRRSRGQCERCSAPTTEGSVFCEEHRAPGAGRTRTHGASLEMRRALLADQEGRCPICAAKVDRLDSVALTESTGHLRAVLHSGCQRLVGLAEAVGPEGLSRLETFLWPGTPPSKKPRRPPRS